MRHHREPPGEEMGGNGGRGCTVAGRGPEGHRALPALSSWGEDEEPSAMFPCRPKHIRMTLDTALCAMLQKPNIIAL